MLPTPVLQAAYRMRFLLSNNASTILTSTGVAGTVTTAVLTARATFKASQTIGEREIESLLDQTPAEMSDQKEFDSFVAVVQELSTLEKIRLVWPLYIPPTVTGITTIMAIIYAHKVDAKKIAALVAATSISEKALIEYKDKVTERLTKAQATKIQDEIAQNKVDGNPPPSNIVILEGNVLCMDVLTGRYFESTREKIERAVNTTNHHILNHMGASVADFHDELGLDSTPYTQMVGWNTDNLIDVHVGTATDPHGRPCLTIDFNYPPTAGFETLH